MYICNCVGVSDRSIKKAVNEGATTVKQLRDQLGVASCCGKCACDAREVIFDTLLSRAERSQRVELTKQQVPQRASRAGVVPRYASATY